MKFVSLIVSAAVAVALSSAAGMVTAQGRIHDVGPRVDLLGYHMSDVELNVDEFNPLTPISLEMGGSTRGSAAFSLEPASVLVPLPVSVLLLLAACGGLAFLSHRRTSAMAQATPRNEPVGPERAARSASGRELSPGRRRASWWP